MSHKYKGIVFGRDIQVDDLFTTPCKKVLDRVKSLAPSLCRLDTQRRILVFDVFITPHLLIRSTVLYDEFVDVP